MDWKKFAIAWVAVFILVTVIGFGIHGVLLSADYVKQVEQGKVRPADEAAALMHFIFLANAVFAAAFVLVYTRGVEEKAWLGQGLRYGVLVAMLWAIPPYMIDYAVLQTTGMLVTKQIIFDSINAVILGVVVAAIYRK